MHLTISTNRMPHTTVFTRLIKAPEHLYYFLLLAGDARHARQPQAWRAWSGMGFDLAVREAPPGVERAERIKVTVNHSPRQVSLRIDGGDATALARLKDVMQSVMQSIAALRASAGGQENMARAQSLAGSQSLQEKLLSPVRASFRDAGLRAEEIEAFESLLKRCLYGLSDPCIDALQVADAAPALA